MASERAVQLWRGAFQINRVFLKLRPIYPIAQRLALNAEVSSVRLGHRGRALNIVMREVGKVTDVLAELVDEVEKIFKELVRLVARWIRLDSQLFIYQNTIDACRASRQDTPIRWGDPLDRRCWKANAQAAGCDAVIWAAACTTREELASTAEEVIALSVVLDRIVSQVSQVANHQTRYLATVANVETRRIGEPEVISLSERLRELSDQISAIDHAARQSVDHMVHTGRALSLALKRAA